MEAATADTDGQECTLVPSNYQEYYSGNQAREPNIAHVLDVFKVEDRFDGRDPKTNRELNAEILGSRDTMSHGYVTLSKNDNRILVLHRVTHHAASMGSPPELWQNQLYALAGDVMGD
jgi:hypothetical protein